LTDESEVCDEFGERLEVRCTIEELAALLVPERDAGRFECDGTEVRCNEKSKAGGR
jgi:hypothetical protein